GERARRPGHRTAGLGPLARGGTVAPSVARRAADRPRDRRTHRGGPLHGPLARRTAGQHPLPPRRRNVGAALAPRPGTNSPPWRLPLSRRERRSYRYWSTPEKVSTRGWPLHSALVRGCG